MSTWTLFTAPGTCALAVHIALNEAGVAHERVNVDFARSQQQSPEYLAINPQGRVPALRTPRGVLTEVPALLTFVAQSFPEAGLAPLDDPFALAEMQALNSYLASTVHVAHAHKRRGTRWTDDAQAIAALQRYVPVSMAACAARLEARLGADPWVLGDRYSVADAYLYTVAGWLDGDAVPLAQYPALAAHHRRVGERPAVQRALAESAA